jgi:hypothetical protein
MLKNLDVFENLTNLRVLDLSRCTQLQNADTFTKLTNITRLILRGCTSLQNVEKLKIANVELWM